MSTATSLQTLITIFKELPGIGPRSAERLAYHLLRSPQEKLDQFADSVKELRESTYICQNCFNYSDEEVCTICIDTERKQQIIMVVEDAMDVTAVERTGKFEGVYHVLGGVIDPIAGISEKELRFSELYQRLAKLSNNLAKEGGLEIVIATNPSTEGETTAMYLRDQLKKKAQKDDLHLKLTRIARGLPVGSNLEYADPVTLSRALSERVNYEY